jgi:hypothetical protein
MAEVSIEIQDNRTRFSPGETVAGRVNWNGGHVESASVRLFWRTEGKGVQDVGLHAETSFDRPRSTDERTFSFVLPSGPLSYDGKILAIIWGLEVELLPGKQIGSIDIVVSA